MARTFPFAPMFAALWLLWPGAAAAQQNGVPMPAQDLLVRQFEAIAFSNEFGGQHRFGRLVRWAEPIRVQLKGINAEAFVPEVDAHLATLRRLTGLPIEVVNGWEVWKKPNLVIVFTAGPYRPDAACWTTFEDRNFAIIHVEIRIPAADPALRRHCIVEELTQAMGLGDDTNLIADSIFDDHSAAQALRPSDELMVLTLYDPRLSPGMRRFEAHPWVRIIISERVAEYSLTHN